MAFRASNLEGLVNFLRIHMGDTGTTPTYSDEVLHDTLRLAVLSLSKRWYDKYYLDEHGVVTRNPNVNYEFTTPPVIQTCDYRPIILMAAIILKGAKKNTESGNAVSWKDDEISYSSIESAKQRDSTLKDDVEELDRLLPVKRLARPLYGRLYGWDESYN